MNAQINPELGSLLSTVADGELDDAQRKRLCDLLRSDPTARRIYRDYMLVHVMIEWDSAEAPQVQWDAPDPTPSQLTLSDAMILPAIRENDEVDAIEEPADVPATASRAIPIPAMAPARRRSYILRHWRGAAAVLLVAGVAIAVLMWSNRRPAATLIGSSQAIWGNSQVIDQRIPAGPTFLKSGLAEIRFASGATMIVAGPARFEVKSSNSAILTSGSITATVPPAADGFAIQTANLRIEDLGTEFGVTANENGSVHVEVFRGTVQTTLASASHSETSSQKLTQGQGVEVRADGSAINPAPAQPQMFVRQGEFDACVAATKGSSYDRWLAYSYELRRDPGLVAYYTFDRVPESSNRLVNLSAEGSKLDGIFVGDDPESPPTWTVGRWLQKGALDFAEGETQGVEVPSPVGSPLDFSRGQSVASPFTIAVWFLLDHPQSGLAMLAKGTDGHEQFGIDFDKEGRMRAWVRPPGEELRDVAIRTTQVSPSSQWQCIAEVYDPALHELSVFINGELVNKTEQVSEKLLQNAGPLMIGCRQRTESTYFPGIEGNIDEVAIFRRPLAADEILKMYQAGKPD